MMTLLHLLLPILVAVAAVRAVFGMRSAFLPRRAVPAQAAAQPVPYILDIDAPGASRVRVQMQPAYQLVPLSRIKDPRERFYAAAAAQGRDEDDIDGLVRSAWRRFAMFFVATVIFASYAIATRSSLCLIPVVALALQAFAAAHGHWQLRNRRLAGFTEFVRQPAEWWPPSPWAQPRFLLLTYEPPVTLETLSNYRRNDYAR